MESISDQIWTSPFFPSPYSKELAETDAPYTTLPELMDKVAQLYGSQRAFGYRSIEKKDIETIDNKEVTKLVLSPEFTYLSYKEVRDRVHVLSKGLNQLGVKPGDRVMILLETRMEWILLAHAISRLGAIVCPLFHTLNDQQITHGCRMTSATILMTNVSLVSKIETIHTFMQNIKQVIYIPDVVAGRAEEYDASNAPFEVISYNQLFKSGETSPDPKPVHIDGDDIGLIMFTSGSTGDAKGVQFRHRSVIQYVNNLGQSGMGPVNPGTSIASYLPLAHNYEFTVLHYNLMNGCIIHFTSPFTLFHGAQCLASGVTPDIMLIQPDMLIMVPLLLEKMKKAVELMVQLTDGPAREDKMRSTFNHLLGGRVAFIVTGGAILSSKLNQFYRDVLMVDLRNGYGSTETGALGCVGSKDIQRNERIGVGHVMRGTMIRLRSWGDGGYCIEDRKGELLIHSIGMCDGYYENQVETDKSFIEVEGKKYWCSGDIGVVFPDGQMEIIDRKKELHKMDNGEYISLSRIEGIIRLAPSVDMVCIVADSANEHLVAIILPNMKVINDMKQRIPRGKDDALIEMIKKQIGLYGCDQLPKRQKPSGVILSPIEWNPDNGLTTSSMKLKRKSIENYFQSMVDDLVDSFK